MPSPIRAIATGTFLTGLRESEEVSWGQKDASGELKWPFLSMFLGRRLIEVLKRMKLEYAFLQSSVHMKYLSKVAICRTFLITK